MFGLISELQYQVESVGEGVTDVQPVRAHQLSLPQSVPP